MKEKHNKVRIIAALITIVFLVGSYFVLLNLFFTEEIELTLYDERVEIEEIDTYVCYTTRTGECYHSGRCQYIRKSSYETTVYEAEQNGYSPCSKCTPRVKTTLMLEHIIKTPRQQTEIKRNYVVPAIISIIIAIACYKLIVYKYSQDYYDSKNAAPN